MTKNARPATRPAGQPQLGNMNDPLLPERSKNNLIQWPTGRELREVAAQLARISKTGIRLEAKGDYFSSGDLAYQIHEIMQASAELFKKSQRLEQ